MDDLRLLRPLPSPVDQLHHPIAHLRAVAPTATVDAMRRASKQRRTNASDGRYGLDMPGSRMRRLGVTVATCMLLSPAAPAAPP
jgi:hypothetical protein